jgi:fructose-specific phosphotransferase system IIC component
MENERKSRTDFVQYGAVGMPVLVASEIVIVKLVEKPELVIPVLIVVATGGVLSVIFGLSLMRRYL